MEKSDFGDYLATSFMAIKAYISENEYKRSVLCNSDGTPVRLMLESVQAIYDRDQMNFIGTFTTGSSNHIFLGSRNYGKGFSWQSFDDPTVYLWFYDSDI